MAIRVLLVEDNDVYRSSLELLLGLQSGLEVVGAIGEGAEAADAARRLAARRRRHGLPAAGARRRGRDARRDRGVGRRGRVPHRGGDRRRARGDPPRRRRRARREGRDRRRRSRSAIRDARAPVRAASVQLTRENTAIVLDSTSDFVDARDRHANMRLVPLYVLFDGEALRDHVDITPEGFYERLAAAKTLPTTSQPTPADFLATLRGACARRASTGSGRCTSPSKLSGTFESAQRAAAQLGDDRVRRRRHGDGLARGRDARGGDRPAPRRRDDGRGG